MAIHFVDNCDFSSGGHDLAHYFCNTTKIAQLNYHSDNAESTTALINVHIEDGFAALSNSWKRLQQKKEKKIVLVKIDTDIGLQMPTSIFYTQSATFSALFLSMLFHQNPLSSTIILFALGLIDRMHFFNTQQNHAFAAGEYQGAIARDEATLAFCWCKLEYKTGNDATVSKNILMNPQCPQLQDYALFELKFTVGDVTQLRRRKEEEEEELLVLDIGYPAFTSEQNRIVNMLSNSLHIPKNWLSRFVQRIQSLNSRYCGPLMSQSIAAKLVQKVRNMMICNSTPKEEQKDYWCNSSSTEEMENFLHQQFYCLENDKELQNITKDIRQRRWQVFALTGIIQRAATSLFSDYQITASDDSDQFNTAILPFIMSNFEPAVIHMRRDSM